MALFELKKSSEPHGLQPPLDERYVPARQNSHCVAPPLDVVPGGQSSHTDAPGCSENVPAAHSTLLPFPPHAEPAGHSTQVVRFAPESSPNVYDPAEQIKQLGAEASL